MYFQKFYLSFMFCAVWRESHVVISLYILIVLCRISSPYLYVSLHVHRVECACDVSCVLRKTFWEITTAIESLSCRMRKCVWNSPILAFVVLFAHQMSCSLSFASFHQFIFPFGLCFDVCCILKHFYILRTEIHDELYLLSLSQKAVHFKCKLFDYVLLVFRHDVGLP